jgi:hypothetical protein
MAKKKSKRKLHVTYNKKEFLAPESILSMAVIHTKIKNCGEAQIRISDCNQTIKLWNDMNDKKQVEEMLTKISNLKKNLTEFEEAVKIKLGTSTYL